MSDPFTIATLALPRGARIGLCRLPGSSGDLDADLAAIVGWQPAVAVSMTEQAEMDAADCSDLGARLQQTGIAWFHLPIRDFGGPERTSEAAWSDLSTRLHQTLDAGDAVLLHCKGGQGRSGMIALRLLVERGADGHDALANLRSVRPGAVETDDQLAWALAGSSV